MWTVFIGIGLGVLEVLLLRKSVVMMSADKANIPLGIFITIGKLALILAVLYCIARFISLSAMIWCAGGMAAAMIVLPVIRSLRTIREGRRAQEEK
ncbi:MAG: hypothetical protein HDQ87_05545 [Clostridia bacterium]|nr:hypothetical protein [Clostridia bacterium]